MNLQNHLLGSHALHGTFTVGLLKLSVLWVASRPNANYMKWEQPLTPHLLRSKPHYVQWAFSQIFLFKISLRNPVHVFFRSMKLSFRLTCGGLQSQPGKGSQYMNVAIKERHNLSTVQPTLFIQQCWKGHFSLGMLVSSCPKISIKLWMKFQEHGSGLMCTPLEQQIYLHWRYYPQWWICASLMCLFNAKCTVQQTLGLKEGQWQLGLGEVLDFLEAIALLSPLWMALKVRARGCFTWCLQVLEKLSTLPLPPLKIVTEEVRPHNTFTVDKVNHSSNISGSALELKPSGPLLCLFKTTWLPDAMIFLSQFCSSKSCIH